MRTRPAPRLPPSMESLLAHPAATSPIATWSRETVKRAIRAVLTLGETVDAGEIIARAEEHLSGAATPEIVRVVNATGVLIHTNLGRAAVGRLGDRGDFGGGARVSDRRI